MRGPQPKATIIKEVHARLTAQLTPREGRRAAAHVAREVAQLLGERIREDPGSLSGPADVEKFVALATRCALVEYQCMPSRRREGEWARFGEVV